jgi:hypothetical protein
LGLVIIFLEDKMEKSVLGILDAVAVLFTTLACKKERCGVEEKEQRI